MADAKSSQARAQPRQKRARNLDDEAIAVIVGILDGWTGGVTWEALIVEIEKRLHCRYTRQALHKRERIRHAFVLHRTLSGDGTIPRKARAASVERQKDQERIARLAAENKRLEAENARLLEQFARWAYNALSRGLDAAFLNRPLPPIDRDRTEPLR